MIERIKMSICKWCKFYDAEPFSMAFGLTGTPKDGWGRCKNKAPNPRLYNGLSVPVGEWPAVMENESCGAFEMRPPDYDEPISLWQCKQCGIGIEQEIGKPEKMCPRCSGHMVLLDQEIYPRTRKIDEETDDEVS